MSGRRIDQSPGGWQELQSSNPILAELVTILAPDPGGLRRWSVMQGIRRKRQATSREIPLKFEAEVERTFRRFCSDTADAVICIVARSDALFYRPKEKAGEVWALLSAAAPFNAVRAFSEAPARP